MLYAPPNLKMRVDDAGQRGADCYVLRFGVERHQQDTARFNGGYAVKIRVEMPLELAAGRNATVSLHVVVLQSEVTRYADEQSGAVNPHAFHSSSVMKTCANILARRVDDVLFGSHVLPVLHHLIHTRNVRESAKVDHVTEPANTGC